VFTVKKKTQLYTSFDLQGHARAHVNFKGLQRRGWSG